MGEPVARVLVECDTAAQVWATSAWRWWASPYLLLSLWVRY